MPHYNLSVPLELIDINTDPIQKNVSLMLSGTMGAFQANIRLAVIPYDNETERQVVISKMEKAAKQLQDLQRWQEEKTYGKKKKLTTKR